MTEKSANKIKVFAWIISAILFLATLETASYLGISYLSGIKPSLIWHPGIDSSVSNIEPEQYLNEIHPILGWPSLAMLKGKEFDSLGSRRNTWFDESQKPCVATYGDSFTWSDEVSYEHAWPNVLSKSLNCRVANFGIGGYGVDQAVLRHKINMNDKSVISILTIVPYNAFRNLNQLRSLIHGNGTPYSLKPRFILKNNKLRLVPIPDITKDELLDLSIHPDKFLKHELFLPGAEYGSIPVRFPYSQFWWDLVNNKGFTDRIKTRYNKRPHWWDFYQPNHSSKSLELLVELVREFTRNSIERNQKPVITFLPDYRSIEYFQSSGSWEYKPLIDALQALNIKVFNTGDIFLKKLGKKSFCSILTKPTECNGHFNEEGYSILAEIIEKILKAENIPFNNT